MKDNTIANVDAFNSIRDIAFTCYLLETTWDDDICIEDADGEYIRRKLVVWNKYLPSLNEEHSGDCTNECHTCTRCYVEKFINLAYLISKEVRGDQ